MPPPPLTVGLVAGAARKASGRRRARDLYVSDLFRKASAYPGGAYDRWYIFSAKYGLVDLGDEIEPYDLTLNRMAAPARRDWAAGVLAQLRAPGLPEGTRFFFHAGARYREYLETELPSETPLRGLSIGRQFAWFARRPPPRSAADAASA